MLNGVVLNDGRDEDSNTSEQWIKAIDLLIDGQYRSVPEGTDPISRKLSELAKALHKAHTEELYQVVEIASASAKSVTATASMMSDIKEVDIRTQAISSAVEEMVASVKEIAHHGDGASKESAEAMSSARVARSEAEKAVSAMDTIAGAVRGAAGKVDTLADASKQIGEIVGQIEAIAKQTNLLALNATIEAARAGEAGKGFAVVAGEVKNLANQTGRATDDIRQRIEHLQNEMHEIVTSMNQGAEAVKEGQEVISSTGESMRDVSDRIEGVSSKINEVSTILGQQTQATSEVAEGISVIAEMVGHNVHGINSIIDEIQKGEAHYDACLQHVGKMEIADFTLYVAKSDHLIWRQKLAEMMVGRISLKGEELADHNTCRLGRWYHEMRDPDLCDHPAFKELEGPHAAVHAAGKEAARLFAAGDMDGARRKLEELDRASQKVMDLLDRLIKR